MIYVSLTSTSCVWKCGSDLKQNFEDDQNGWRREYVRRGGLRVRITRLQRCSSDLTTYSINYSKNFNLDVSIYQTFDQKKPTLKELKFPVWWLVQEEHFQSSQMKLYCF